MIHTLLIHQAFVSPDSAGGTRHYEFARQMVDHGNAFTIVASTVSYLDGRSTRDHNKLIEREDFDGVTVLRAYTVGSHHRGILGRLVSFISFMTTSVLAALKAPDVDVVLGTSPPLFQALSAWLVSVIRRRPFLLEIRDLWPDFLIDMGKLRNPLAIAGMRSLETFLYRSATHIIVNSPAFRDHLVQRGLSGEKISLVPNGVDPDMFDATERGEAFRREWQLADKFLVTYAGALGAANDIDTVLMAARRLLDRDHIRILLVGDGGERKRLEQKASDLGLRNVLFTGARPKTEMRAILGATDVCLAILQNIRMFRTVYPNKVFDYMAAGRPTILAIDGVIRDVLEAAGGGRFVQPGDDAALAAAIAHFADHRDEGQRMGASAREYVVRHFDRRTQAKEFAGVLARFARRT